MQDRTQTCDFANRAGVAAAGLGGPLGGGFGGQLGGGLGSLMGSGAPAASSSFGANLAGFGSADALSDLGRMGGHGQPPPPPGQPGFGDGRGGLSQLGGQGQYAQQQAQQQAQQAQQQAQQQAEAEARRLAAERQQQAAREQAAQAAASQLGAGGVPQAPGVGADGAEQTVIPNLSSYLHINAGLQLFAQQPQLKRLVPVAIDRAIREIIQPVVERSVTIACVTTRELMLKDFAMEPDETRMKKAAQLMAQTLAGSLALVTCKEPLRVACSSNMRTLLQQAGAEAQLVEQVVQVCSSENLDLCCTLIEKAAKEKAVRDVEEALAPAFAIRRKHREQTGLPYYDMSIFTSGRYPASLPEALRPKAGGLLPAQRRVYEDFNRIPRVTAALAQQTTAAATGPFGAGMPGGGGSSQSLAGFGQNAQMPGAAAGGIGGLGNAASPLRGGLGGGDSSLPMGGAQMPAGLGQMGLGGMGGSANNLIGGQAGEGGQLTTVQALEKLGLVMVKLDAHLSQLVQGGVTQLASLPADHEVHTLVRQVGSVAGLALTRDETALAMVQRIVKRMYEQAGGGGRMYTQVNVQLILAIHQVSKKVSRFVSDILLYSDDERKLHGEIVSALLHAGLLSMGELSSHLAKHIDGGRNAAATSFAIRLVRSALLEEQIATGQECAELLQALSKLTHAPQGAPDGLMRLLEDASRLLGGGGLAGAPAAAGHAPAAAAGSSTATAASLSAATIVETRMALASRANASAGADKDDAQMQRVKEQAMPLWTEWLEVVEQTTQSDKAYSTFLGTLQSAGWLRADQNGERFLRALLEIAFAAASHASAETSDASSKPPLSFAPLDALSTLVVLMIKNVPSDANAASSPSDAKKPSAQVAMLVRVLSLLIQQLVKAYERAPHDFNQRAYLRVLGSFLFELNAPDPALDPIQPQVLSAFAAAFLALQPSRLPGFAFAWLELISHRMFMPKILLAKGQRGWPHMQRLLVGLFSFLQPYLSQGELSPPTRTLYRGALRVLLVLLHDFPEFLCDYHFALCDVIPPSCIQMRNLVLSAFPRNMRLPDPFTPNLKVDLLPEIAQPPRILSPVTAPLVAANLLNGVDDFLNGRAPLSALDLRFRLVTNDGTPRSALINALVLHAGQSGIAALQNSQAQAQALAHSPPMELYQRLASELQPDARYVLLNAIANQLRYPNNHTHCTPRPVPAFHFASPSPMPPILLAHALPSSPLPLSFSPFPPSSSPSADFSCVLLYLFAESTEERVQEQVTRVLVERLIVHRPHPWGLLITFIELIKNPRYAFWTKAFTRCAPRSSASSRASRARAWLPAPRDHPAHSRKEPPRRRAERTNSHMT